MLNYVSADVLTDAEEMSQVGETLAGSYFGVCVAPSNWESNWVNKAMATFVERKVRGTTMSATKDFDIYEHILGNYSLNADLTWYGPESPLAQLKPNLTGLDPLQGYSSI